MSTNPLLQPFLAKKIIGIVRTPTLESCLWISRILIETGITLIEIPFTVPNAAQAIETLSETYPHATIGAGTVLEAREAILALGAGAQFLISPVLLEPLIQLGVEQNILVLPGCITPTEIYKAWTLGAPAVKFFPAESAGGADFIRSLKGPLPQIPIIPTGGIHLEQVPGYLKAGALAVGVGSPLLPQRLIEAQDETALKALASSYLAACGMGAL